MLNEHRWNDSIASVHTRGLLFLACRQDINRACSAEQSFAGGGGSTKLLLTVAD